ncbi:uridine kinase family protein [Streptomyces mirabilis]|uniref:uridine kinase family protein n=1 Tax=Streptomyces mirabilis TaxID=68239 RepID=UPI000A621720
MTCDASVPAGARRPPLEWSSYRGACARRADAPASHRTSGTVIRDLAARLRALPPSCGPVRLIGVDGHAGSGKTTFAGRLAAALGDAPVLHLDDIATHEELFGWTRRLLGQVVEPLSRGETARYVPYDWSARAFGPVRELRPAPVILLEGVGAGRRALRPYLTRLLWMELARDEAWTRGRRRDGEAQSAFWAGWVAAERQHFVEDPSKPFADLLVRQCSEGYEVFSGPTETAGPDQPLTHGDGSSAMC